MSFWMFGRKHGEQRPLVSVYVPLYMILIVVVFFAIVVLTVISRLFD